MEPAHDSPPAPPRQGAELDRVLDAHAAWAASGGRRGRRAALEGADLKGADLSGRDLTRADLSGADLSGADLSEAVLDHARMTRVRLEGADLLGASLVEANLTWAVLARARLGSADLTGACLADADLTGARLKGTDLTNADLEGADLRGADLTATVMTGTDLTGAVFDAPAADARLDAAYEAEDVLAGHDEPVAVSELPDADLEEVPPEPPEEAASVGAEGWVRAPEGVPPSPRPAAAPAAPPPPRPETGRADAVARALAGHAEWLAGGVPGRHALLHGVSLAGLSLRGADLRRADLTGVRDLAPAALAGADLEGAALPEGAADPPGVARVAAIARMARKLFVALLLGCLYTAVTIATSAGLPLGGGGATLLLPILGTPVPVLWFYLGAPALVLGAYLWLQVYLQRMWEVLGTLPAVFPDGEALDARCDPWLPVGLVRAHLPRLRHRPRPMGRLQDAAAIVLVWYAAPATLAFLWGAFLLRVGPLESAFHALAAAAAWGFGAYAHLLARRTLAGSKNNPL